MKKFTKVLVVVLLILMNLDFVFADEEETRTYEIDVFSNKASYYEFVTDTDTVIIEVTDENLPSADSRIIGTEEFAPGSYTRTIYYKRQPNSAEALEVKWKVYFTVYATTQMPKITSVSDFIIRRHFASYTEPIITRASATTSAQANAYAYVRDVVYKPDGKSTIVYMNFNLYHDDSASIDMQDIVASN